MKKIYALLTYLLIVPHLFSLQAQTITTIAGTGTPGYNGDGIAATIANLNQPTGIAIDNIGNIVIGDYKNNRIRKIGSDGFISTIAGTNGQGYNGDGIAATTATLFSPETPAFDRAGNLYFNDGNNNRIRKIAAGFIYTIAGTGVYGYNGDNIAAAAAQVNFPTDGVAVDGAGNIYFSDTYNNRVRKISTNGTITTVAGTGTAGYNGDNIVATAAQINLPYGLAFDAADNLYIADGRNNRIRKVSNGIITTVAGTGTGGYGSDGISATTAMLNYPEGVAIDGAGNIYIADYLNNRIRKVTVGTGVISTVAGTGVAGYNGDNIAATLAQVNYPVGVAFDKFGNLYIADFNNHRVRKVDNIGPILPLTLTRFTVSSVGSNGLLQWQTANEVNTQKFVIEISYDGSTFSTVDSVVAKGAAASNKYSFTDVSIKSGVTFYRLKMIDKDGKYTYSNVVSLWLNEPIRMVLSPNPVENVANLSFTASLAGKHTIQIIDMAGKTIQKIVINAVTGSNKVTIDTHSYSKGEYVLTTTNASGLKASVKFTK